MSCRRRLVTHLLPVLAVAFAAALYLSLFTSAALAAGEFSTAYDVTYEVHSDGATTVIQQVTITNKTPDYYVSEYTVTIGSDSVSEVTASDAGGPLAVEVREEEGVNGGRGTRIHVVFNEQVAGVGRQLAWTLRYRDSSIAAKRGQIWEVNIPRLSLHPEIDEYRVTLWTSAELGSLLYISPDPVSQRLADTGQRFSFTRSQMTASGVRAAFGGNQLYHFRLTYHLKNPGLTSALTEIALPPDITDFQRIFFTGINPAPSEIKVDTDGNYLAQFKLSGSEQRDIVVEGLAQVFYRDGVAASDSFSPYLLANEYWEVDDPLIREVAEELSFEVRDCSSPSCEVTLAKAVYDYVVETLTYDRSRAGETLERMGALGSLERRDHAICVDFADLFVTLARAVGIPARSLEGYAFTEEENLRSDVLHGWAQVYLPERGWVSVDPTWGATTGQDYFDAFDLNHIVFAIKGLQSDYPFPAGAYKIDLEETDDVAVDFASAEDLSSELTFPGIGVSTKFEATALSVGRLPFRGWLEVRNDGPAAIFNVKTQVSSSFEVRGSRTIEIGTLPPYTSQRMRLDLVSDEWWRDESGQVTVDLEYADFSGARQTREFNHYLVARPLVLWIGTGVLLIVMISFGLRFLLRRHPPSL